MVRILISWVKWWIVLRQLINNTVGEKLGCDVRLKNFEKSTVRYGVIAMPLGMLMNLLDVLDSNEVIKYTQRCKIDKNKSSIAFTDRRVLLLNENYLSVICR